jgi:histidinol dehydrogenase
MGIQIYDLKTMDPVIKAKIMRRAEEDISEQMKIAREIADDVKANGDQAVIKYTEKFDRAKLTPGSIKVTQEEIEEGYKKVSDEYRDALEFAAKNIRLFHEKQMPEPIWFTETSPGIMAGEQTQPVPDICIYVPRGKGSFPSVMLMMAIPAVVAQVPNIVILTPPNEEGTLDDGVLAAAKVCGVSNIYKAGGIQGVAAVAYGTETIPKCSKIIGPGSSYVTAAKRVLSDEIDAGTPAGPSEGVILADGFADYEKVGLDLMIEAEHGPDSAALLVTDSRELAEKVKEFVAGQIPKLSEQRKRFVETVFSEYGGIIITESLQESIDFINDYAPEHMEVMTKDPWEVLPKIKNAGEILLGENTPITMANFLIGVNAILPTGRSARTHSSVSVFDFLKKTSVGYVTKDGFESARKHASVFARVEGFETHALAVEERK